MKRDAYTALLEGFQETYMAYRRLESNFKLRLPSADPGAVGKELFEKFESEFKEARTKLYGAMTVGRVVLSKETRAALSTCMTEDVEAATAAKGEGIFEFMRARRKAIEQALERIERAARVELGFEDTIRKTVEQLVPKPGRGEWPDEVTASICEVKRGGSTSGTRGRGHDRRHLRAQDLLRPAPGIYLLTDRSESVACDAAVAINMTVADLLLPRHIFRLFTDHEAAGRISPGYATVARRLAGQVIVVNLFRLWEAREHLLCPWLFSDPELRALGLPPLEEVVDAWPALLRIRHQFAGHMLSRRANKNNGEPGRILPPEAFGRALRESGLLDLAAFLARVEEEIIPAVERVRAELFRRWPASEDYVRRIYPGRINDVAGGDAGTGE